MLYFPTMEKLQTPDSYDSQDDEEGGEGMKITKAPNNTVGELN